MTVSKSQFSSDVVSPREYGLMACLLLTATYVITGKLGLMLALPPGYASPIFPPAGIAIAAALIRGRKSLPWIFLGSLLLNLWVGHSTTQQISALSLVVALIIAIASVLQAALGGWGLRRIIGYPVSLDHGGEVLRFLVSAPVICLTSATISVASLSYLGIFKPDDFIINWAAWWVGDTLGLLVMFPLFMILAGEPRSLWRGRKFTVAAPMLLVFSLFVMVFLKANQWEYKDSLMEFRQLSAQTSNAIQLKLGEQEFALEQTASLFAHNRLDQVTREEFHRFVQNTLSRFPAIQALAWAPMVSSERRASFEKSHRKDFQNFEIRERNDAGQLIRSAQSKIFYPVTFIEPIASNETAVGYDLLSDAIRREALSRAMQSGKMVATPALHLVQDSEPKVSLLLLQAIDWHDRDAGVVSSILRIHDFMEAQLLNSRALIYTRIVDLEDQKNIFDNFPTSSTGAMYEQAFVFGSRHYRIETAPTPLYISTHQGWQSWSVLAAGILGTGLLGALFLLGTGYTTRVQAQVDERTSELNESKIRLQEAQRLAQIGNWELDLSRNKLIWSDEIYRIFELDPDSFCASYETFLNAIHPEDRAKVEAAFAESINNRSPYSIEHRLMLPDGRIKFVHERGATYYDSKGRALRSVGTVQDVTVRRQAEEMLRDNETRLKNLFENLSSGVAVYRVSPDGKDFFVTDFNRAAERIDKFHRNDLIGKNITEVFPAAEEFGILEVLRRVWRSGLPEHFPVSFYKDDHISGWRDNYIYKLPSGEVVAIYDDVTKEKQAEEQIRQLAYYDALTNLPNRVLFTGFI